MNRSIVIVFDCLPAHWLGCYGNFNVVTPAFDWLATQSVVFDRYFANSPGATSAAPLTSGWYASPNAGELIPPITEPEDVAAELSSSQSGLVWLWMPETAEVSTPKDDETSEKDEPAEHVVEQCDEMLVEVLEQIDVAGWSDALLVATANRGVDLSELWSDKNPVPGQSLASIGPNSSNLRLPLMIRHPTVQSFRSQSITQPVDVLPTLQDWAASETTEDVQGHSLLPLMTGTTDRVREHGFFGDETHVGIIADEFVLFRPRDDSREPQLFLQPDDRWMMHNVAVEYPDVVEALTAVLDSWES